MALAASTFLVYAWGACRTIYVGDSGELVAAVHLLGIPHPSGYPLYVLLGKLWTLVPFGSVAFRMSLFSAACAAATCGILYLLCSRLGLRPSAGATAALLLAFSPSFWGEANIQRVYALNALFLGLATALAFAWHRTRRPSALAAAAFACGLGATNHTFMALCGAALAVFALVTEPALFRRPAILKVAAAGLAGLAPYAYLPLRSRMNPPLDWGNPETWNAFLAVVTRRDFWERRWIETPLDLVPITADYLASLGRELLWLGAGLALLGLVVGWRRRWPVLFPVLVMAANLGAMAVHGSRTDIFIWHRYYIPSYFMAALLAGMGAQALAERLKGPVKLLPLVIPVVALVTGWREFDRSRYRIAEDFSRTLLSSLPAGAHLAADDDNILFVLIYLYWVEGLRPDVDLVLQGVGEANLPPLRFNPDTDPLYLTHYPNWAVPGLEVVPVGLVFRTIRAGSPIPPATLAKTVLDGEDDPRVPKDYLTSNLVGQFHYMLGATSEASNWPAAWREFRLAQTAAPLNDVLFFNLGLILRRNGLFDEALAAFERSDAINPRHIASRDRVRASDEVAATRRERDRVRDLERGLGAVGPTAAEQRRMADLLAARGEVLAARGHRLRAEVLEAGS